jgi:hypothetical protein
MAISKKQMDAETRMLRGISRVYQIQCGECLNAGQSQAVNEACAAEDFYKLGWRPIKKHEDFDAMLCPSCLRKLSPPYRPYIDFL